MVNLRRVLPREDLEEFERYKEKQSILRQRHKAKLSLRTHPVYKSLLKHMKKAKEACKRTRRRRLDLQNQINQMVDEEADRLLDLERKN